MKLFRDSGIPTPPYPHLDKPYLLHPKNVDALSSYEFNALKARVNAWLADPSSSKPNVAIDNATALALYYGAEGLFMLAQVLHKKCEIDKADGEPYESTLVKASMLYRVALALMKTSDTFADKASIEALIQSCQQLIPTSITPQNFQIEIDDLLHVYLPDSLPGIEKKGVS